MGSTGVGNRYLAAGGLGLHRPLAVALSVLMTHVGFLGALQRTVVDTCAAG